MAVSATVCSGSFSAVSSVFVFLFMVASEVVVVCCTFVSGSVRVRVRLFEVFFLLYWFSAIVVVSFLLGVCFVVVWVSGVIVDVFRVVVFVIRFSAMSVSAVFLLRLSGFCGVNMFIVRSV